MIIGYLLLVIALAIGYWLSSVRILPFSALCPALHSADNRSSMSIVAPLQFIRGRRVKDTELARTPKPEWLKVRAPGSSNYLRLRGLMRDLNLHTVCEEAHCPNIGECWHHGTATFMIMGDVCTRACGYCNVKHGAPIALDPAEPAKLAEAVDTLELNYVVVTSVDRDDLDDFGAARVRGDHSRDQGPPAGVSRGGAHSRLPGRRACAASRRRCAAQTC